MEPITITFLVLAIVGWAAAIALAVFFLVNKSKEKAARRLSLGFFFPRQKKKEKRREPLCG